LQPCMPVFNKAVLVKGVDFHDLMQRFLRHHGAIVRHA
jgi:hypothetical protein